LESLATKVKGVTIQLSVHWISEEQSEFVVEQLLKFFGENKKGIYQIRTTSLLLLFRGNNVLLVNLIVL
jgi:hypothetical protein